MGIKAFLFDCGGVVLRDKDDSAYTAWGTRLGLSSEALRERLYSGKAWQMAEIGQLTEDEFWVQAGQELGLEDDEQISALRQDLWGSWSVDEQVLAIIDQVREHARVAMLSNATDVLEEMLANQYRVADRFEPIFNSARLGIAKPDPAIYQHVLAEMDLKPQEMVFIDDRADNIAAAVTAGIHVVWFVDPSELARQLAPYIHQGNGHESESENDATLSQEQSSTS